VPTTILIVDDHAGFRTRAKRALEADGFLVVGEAGDLQSGLAESERLQPDVVLLDIHLPDGSGVDAAPNFIAQAHASSVVLVSTYDAADLEHAISEPGVAGFLPKAELSGKALNALLSPPAAV
jgi:DNA-binding NarL/FixJ family response regulator